MDRCLTTCQVAQAIDHLRKGDPLPGEVLLHTETCQRCRKRIMEACDFVDIIDQDFKRSEESDQQGISGFQDSFFQP